MIQDVDGKLGSQDSFGEDTRDHAVMQGAFVLYSDGRPVDRSTLSSTSTYVGSPPPHKHELHEYTDPFRSPNDETPVVPATKTEPIADLPPAPAQSGKEAGDKGTKKKSRKMHPLVKGIVVLTAGPFVMAGATVAAAGALFYGVGQIIVGMGDLMMGGPLKKHVVNAWRNRKEERT